MPHLKLGSFTKASTAVTPPKEWPMTATLVTSRLFCKKERAEESEAKPHEGWSLIGEKKPREDQQSPPGMGE